MEIIALPKYDMTDNPTGCCPRFHSEGWDNQNLHYHDKSTMVESTLLALIGGAVGGTLAFLLFNGFQVSTLNSASFSQVVFDFAVTGDLLIDGLFAALVIGVFGGFFPAIRVARLPVAQALREL